MTTILKYIINVSNVPVLFGRDILHNSLGQEIKSAGFLMISYDSINARVVVKCFGESTSLNIKSNPIEDNKLIENFFNDTANEGL